MAPVVPPSLTFACMWGAEGHRGATVVTVATALASAADRVVLAVIANPSAGATRGEPRPLREVTAVGVAVALALCSHRGQERSQSVCFILLSG